MTQDPNNAMPIVVGSWVRWYKNGWRFGQVELIGTKFAYVRYLGKLKRIPVKEVEAYDARSAAE